VSLQRVIADAWCEVLSLAAVSPTDRFWTLGGSSFQAVEVAYRIGASLKAGTRPPLPVSNGTLEDYVRDVALHLQQAAAAAASTRTERQPPAINDGLSSAHAQMLFLDGMGDAWKAYRTHARIEFHGALRHDWLTRSLDMLVTRHEMLRAAFVTGGPGQPRLRVATEVGCAVTAVDLSARSSAEQRIELDAIQSRWLSHRFDVSAAPLVNWTLVKLSEDRHVLFHVEHHSVGDAASLRTLLGELAQAYRAHATDRSPAVVPVTATYTDFAQAEANWMVSENFGRALDGWDRLLRPYVQQPPLCLVRRLANERSFDGAQVRRRLHEDFTACLG
jgi:hypothetical protein